MYNKIVSVKINRLIWDEWNVEHIKKHNVSVQEVESLIKSQNVVFVTTYNDRIIVLGKLNNRMLSVVISREKSGEYYIITARDMSKKERRFYRDETKK